MIEVQEPGFLTSVQTALGRTDYRHLGVPVGGAADGWSARLANRLVGNADDAPLLEITLTGPTLRFTEPALVALAGTAFETSVDSLPLPAHEARRLRAGAVVRIREGRGARAYLAVAGGLVVSPTLGSASTDLRSGFGGLGGRALRTGDVLQHGGGSGPGQRWRGAAATGPIRVIDGPHASAAPEGWWADVRWRVGDAADRTAARLEGPAVALPEHEVPSMALPLGAIQVPPDGHPIVMLADRPVTGGYAAPACVIRADVGRVAQLRPGDELTLEWVTLDEARAASAAVERALDRLEPIPMGDDDATAWSGAHG